MLLLLARGRELPSRQSHALELVGYGQLDDTSGRTVDQRPVGQFTETHLGVALLAEGVEYHRSRRAPLQLLLIRLARQQYLLRSTCTLLQPDGAKQILLPSKSAGGAKQILLPSKADQQELERSAARAVFASLHLH